MSRPTIGNKIGAWRFQIAGSACQTYSVPVVLLLKLVSSAPISLISTRKRSFSNTCMMFFLPVCFDAFSIPALSGKSIPYRVFCLSLQNPARPVDAAATLQYNIVTTLHCKIPKGKEGGGLIPSQMLKGTLEGCIMAIISRQPTYGYEIADSSKTTASARSQRARSIPCCSGWRRTGWPMRSSALPRSAPSASIIC